MEVIAFNNKNSFVSASTCTWIGLSQRQPGSIWSWTRAHCLKTNKDKSPIRGISLVPFFVCGYHIPTIAMKSRFSLQEYCMFNTKADGKESLYWSIVFKGQVWDSTHSRQLTTTHVSSSRWYSALFWFQLASVHAQEHICIHMYMCVCIWCTCMYILMREGLALNFIWVHAC